MRCALTSAKIQVCVRARRYSYLWPVFRNKYDVHLDFIVRVLARSHSLSHTHKYSVVGLPCTGCALSIVSLCVFTAKFVVASRAHER